ncbi:MAG: hypothetical protein ACREJC_23025 [Tepidisphaeraceae bacterium]
MKNRKLAYVAMGLSGVLIGCQSDKSSFQDFFPSTAAENRAVNKFADTQAASGARADATLYPRHFDGESLNSLGSKKLDSMLADDDTATPMLVYMDLDHDGELKPRRDAVVRYLVDHGMTKDQVEFRAGPNPHTGALAAPQAARLGKTESGGSGSESWSTESNAATGTAGTGNGGGSGGGGGGGY